MFTISICEKKTAIRAFMQRNYTDERLAQLLAHARDGKLAYFSCCCFIGVATADHALRGDFGDPFAGFETPGDNPHYPAAKQLPGAIAAEFAFQSLSTCDYDDSMRRRILIPIIRAEMRRREKIRSTQPYAEQTAHEDQESILRV